MSAMALDARKQQKKVEKRKAKDKARKLAEREKQKAFYNKLLASIPTASILECWVGASLQESGIGHVILCRELSSRQVAYADFLVDSYCLGVKDVLFRIEDRGDYELFMSRVREGMDLEKASPEFVRLVVDGAVEYAANLGFTSHPDFQKAKPILANIDTSGLETTFEFGCDGKPFYVSGPNESPDRVRAIILQLHERCGPKGFDYLARVSSSEVGRLIEAGLDGEPGQLDDEYDFEDED
jgi:hypothetical protein